MERLAVGSARHDANAETEIIPSHLFFVFVKKLVLLQFYIVSSE